MRLPKAPGINKQSIKLEIYEMYINLLTYQSIQLKIFSLKFNTIKITTILLLRNRVYLLGFNYGNNLLTFSLDKEQLKDCYNSGYSKDSNKKNYNLYDCKLICSNCIVYMFCYQWTAYKT